MELCIKHVNDPHKTFRLIIWYYKKYAKKNLEMSPLTGIESYSCWLVCLFVHKNFYIGQNLLIGKS